MYIELLILKILIIKYAFQKGDENLLIPIHAYPITSGCDFPTKYSFPKTAIGKSVTKKFNMRSTAPIEFEYMIEVTEYNPAFRIEPMEGIIPFNRDAFINVTYSPIEFCTSSLSVKLVISQFNSKPINCKFYGFSQPGLIINETTAKALKQRLANKADMSQENFDPRCYSPLSLSRAKKIKQITYAQSGNMNFTSKT